MKITLSNYPLWLFGMRESVYVPVAAGDSLKSVRLCICGSLTVDLWLLDGVCAPADGSTSSQKHFHSMCG